MSEKQNNNKQINDFAIDKVIDNIDDNNNIKEIYKSLWGDKNFFEDKDIKVQKVFSARYKKYSNNSYAFQIEDNKGNIIR